MGIERILVICAGAFAMLILMFLRRKAFPTVAMWKIPMLCILLTITGVLGTMIMFYIETGEIGGTSFYGAVLFIPILMIPAVLLRIPYNMVMDLCAPSICIMLAVMKIDCLMSGCCIGKYLPSLGFQFPSQIVEMIVALIILFILLRLEGKGTEKNKLYPYFMILYGSTRFVLNWFRYGLVPYVWILPNSNVWSLVAIFIGGVWLILLSKSSAKKHRS